MYVDENDPTPLKKNAIVNIFLQLLYNDVLSISVGEKAPVVFFELNSKDLDISNDTDLLECFVRIPLPDVAENNHVDIEWIQNQHGTSTALSTKAAKYPDQYFNKLSDDQVTTCYSLMNKD